MSDVCSPVSIIAPLGRSDHNSVLFSLQKINRQNQHNKVIIRQGNVSAKRAFSEWLTKVNWLGLYQTVSCETKLNMFHNACFFDMPGYNFISQNRIGKSGGGVAFYLDNKYEYKIRYDLNYNDSEVLETLFIEISNPIGKNIIAGVVYRPPNNNVETFTTTLNSIICRISKENKICYVVGDMNLNIMNHEVHTRTGEFLDSMLSFMMYPCISLYLRDLLLIQPHLLITSLLMTMK